MRNEANDRYLPLAAQWQSLTPRLDDWTNSIITAYSEAGVDISGDDYVQNQLKEWNSLRALLVALQEQADLRSDFYPLWHHCEVEVWREKELFRADQRYIVARPRPNATYSVNVQRRRDHDYTAPTWEFEEPVVCKNVIEAVATIRQFVSTLSELRPLP